MARLRAGILGNLRGKVAGVVGSQWKDKNYIREYVKPANPNTSAQQTQRTKMSDCVAFAKTLVGPVFNAYTDRFQKSMSGFNYFIKQNIAEFDGSIDYSALKLTEGKLSPILMAFCTYTTGSGVVANTFSANKGNNGEDTDPIYGAAYHVPTGLWYFPAAETTRSSLGINMTLPTGLTPTDIEVWVWPVQKVNTLVTSIANSDHQQAVAP